jgi:hypothetical protein
MFCVPFNNLTVLAVLMESALRPRSHGTGRICDRSEICPFSPVYTRIRPVRGSQIRPVPWFSCVYTAETDEFQTGPKFVWYRVKPVFHLRIFSREANFSFVFGLSTGIIWN